MDNSTSAFQKKNRLVTMIASLFVVTVLGATACVGNDASVDDEPDDYQIEKLETRTCKPDEVDAFLDSEGKTPLTCKPVFAPAGTPLAGTPWALMPKELLDRHPATSELEVDAEGPEANLIDCDRWVTDDGVVCVSCWLGTWGRCARCGADPTYCQIMDGL